MKLTQIEGKSPHKKGSAKYKKHMAAKHASMGEKVEALKEIVERAKHVKANSKKPKLEKPSKGHQSSHPYHKTPNFVGGESVELNENPLAGGLAIVLRGLAGQGWKYGAQAGAKGAAKFTGTKMGQRAAQKVGAGTIKKVGVAGGKIAGGTAGLAADAYLLDKLVDQFGEDEVTNALRQAQGGKQQMFTDMLNKAVQTGVVSTDELDAAMGMYENLDEISMQDIKKGAKVAAVTGAIALGGAGIGKVTDYMNQSSYDYSIQLPQLEMYLDYAEAQKDQRMIKQLKTRIRNHEGRLSMGKGDVYGQDGTPMTFEVVYDKENPDFDPLGDPMQLNKKFQDARDNKNEAKQPKQNNPVAKHSRNMPGAGAHKSPKDYDRKKTKQDLKKELDKSLNEDIPVEKGKQFAMDLFQKHFSSQEVRDVDMKAVQKAAELYYTFKATEKLPGFKGKEINHKQAYDMALAGTHDYLLKDKEDKLPDMSFEAKYSADKNTLVKAVVKSLEKKAMDGDVEDIKFLRRLASLVDKKVFKRENGALTLEDKIPFTQCPNCRGDIVHESELIEAKKKKKKKQDACYHKVKSRYKVWPSAYASGALVQCRKKGAKNWGNKSKKK